MKECGSCKVVTFALKCQHTNARLTFSCCLLAFASMLEKVLIKIKHSVGMDGQKDMNTSYSLYFYSFY